jgi:2-C-methyl-D-erythritol 4-phosphate cytidylyltransferase
VAGSTGVVAVVLAAGSGERLGAATPKAFLPLAGRPMALFSVEAAAASHAVDAVILVVPPALERAAIDALLAAAPNGIRIDVVPGGASRQESVRHGLRAVPEWAEFVVIHDAARPFASPGLFARVVSAVRDAQGAAVIPVVSSPDTIKRVRDGLVVETLPRDEVALSQTPQAFAAGRLREAHARAVMTGSEGTDDAMLCEAAGDPVLTVPGEASNFKITTREDLERAERLARARADAVRREG